MAVPMGLGALASKGTVIKWKHRWLFNIPQYSQGGTSPAFPALPPKRGSRPSVTFPNLKAEHLIETIYFPGKPDWGTVDLTLYDVANSCSGLNQIFQWLKNLYDPNGGNYYPSLSDGANGAPYKIPTSTMTLLDGCGNVVETWIYENVYPERIEWGELDMETSDIVTVDLTLRFDRAYNAT